MGEIYIELRETGSCKGIFTLPLTGCATSCRRNALMSICVNHQIKMITFRFKKYTYHDKDHPVIMTAVMSKQ